jgi:hypothetical protein
MESPNLIILWILLAKVFDSSRVNPEVRREVSNSSQMRSLTVLSPVSDSAFSLSSYMMGFSGLISIVFLETM